jgi:hypothetical protein
MRRQGNYILIIFKEPDSDNKTRRARALSSLDAKL